MNRNDQQKYRFKKAFVNSFAVLGYFVVVFQVLIVFIAYFTPIENLLQTMIPESQPKEVQAPPPTFDEGVVTSPLFLVVGGVITVIMIIISLYAIIRAPVAIARTGRKMTQGAAKQVAPMVLQAQHKKTTKRNIVRLTPALAIVFKLIVILGLLVAAWVAPSFVEQVLVFDITILIAQVTALTAVILFTLQYILAWALRVRRSELW